jgi:hypothetical protein
MVLVGFILSLQIFVNWIPLIALLVFWLGVESGVIAESVAYVLAYKWENSKVELTPAMKLFFYVEKPEEKDDKKHLTL